MQVDTPAGSVSPVQGVIDTYPNFVHCSLLFVNPPAGMTRRSIEVMLNSKFIELAERDIPGIVFDGKLHCAEEAGKKVWRIESRPSPAVAQLRSCLKNMLEKTGFRVRQPHEPLDQVHITLRGRWPNTGPNFPRPSNSEQLRLTFDKLAATPAAAKGEHRKPCGSLIRPVNFGRPEHCRESHATAESDATTVDLGDAAEFPRLTAAKSRQRRPRSNDADWTPQAKRDGDSKVRRSGNLMSDQPVDIALLQDFGVPVEDMLIAVQASLDDASAQSVDRNADLGKSLLCSKQQEKQQDYVWLIEYSRDPKSFHEALASSPVLSGCFRTLEDKGPQQHDVLGPAKAFVRPEQFELVLTFIEFHKPELKPRHVFVSPEFAAELAQCIERIRCKDKVKRKSQCKVPLSFLEAVHKSEFPVFKLKTFIAVQVPSSLCSSRRCGNATV